MFRHFVAKSYKCVAKSYNLLSITHKIYKSINDRFDVRCFFLDISKAFDKVWHEGIIFKLRQIGISGELLNLLCDFLRNRIESTFKRTSFEQGQC